MESSREHAPQGQSIILHHDGTGGLLQQPTPQGANGGGGRGGCGFKGDVSVEGKHEEEGQEAAEEAKGAAEGQEPSGLEGALQEASGGEIEAVGGIPGGGGGG